MLQVGSRTSCSLGVLTFYQALAGRITSPVVALGSRWLIIYFCDTQNGKQNSDVILLSP